MKKRIISLLLVFSLLITLLPTGAMAVETAKDSGTNPFSDVKSTDWFYDAVRYAGEKGFFSGTSATTFEPYGTMTRGMFVTVLGRMAGVNAGDYTGVTGFSDVPETIYYAPYVAWAAQYGITGGTGDGKFSPNAFINRQQMAAFFVRYFEAFGVNYETGANITTTPADLDTVAPYARDAVLKLWKQGLLNGDGVKFSPTGSATRAQASTLCMRTDKTVPVWYSAPGVEGRTGGAEPTAPAKPEQKPGSSSSGSSSGGSSGGSSSGGSTSGGGSTGGGTTTTTYYAVSFAMGNNQTEIGLPKEQTVAAGTPISSLPTPSKPGVVFLGWFYDPELNTKTQNGDTVTRNMTLYAGTAAGGDVRGIETPNYVTKNEQAGDFSFGVTAENEINASVLKFINITDVNTPVDFSVDGSTVTATLEAGQDYKVELLDENARFVLDGKTQAASVRVLNILTKKAEVKKAELNKNVEPVDVSDTNGLADTVFKGLYQIDDTQTISENTTSGTFTYTGTEPLTVGQTLAVTQGTVDLNDVTSDTGDVAYIKITGVNGGDSYNYEMADVEDVLFIPDVLPIQNDWDTDSNSTNHSITVKVDDLAIAMKNVEADAVDEGDFLAFIEGSYNSTISEAAEESVTYGKITGVTYRTIDNDDFAVITYADANPVEIESALDVYYQEDKDIKVSGADKERIENDLKKNIQNSNYPAEAASYVMAVMEQSNGLDTAPDPAAVAAYMDTISTYARADGSIVLYADGKEAKAEVDWKNFKVKIGSSLSHLQGSGFRIWVEVPINLKMGDVTINFTATFEEEVILKQNISTKRHKIGFLKYDYSLNASFDIGNYTGINFEAKIQTEGEDDPSASEKLDKIFETLGTIKEYGEAIKDGLSGDNGTTSTDGTMGSLSDIYKEVMKSASDSWVEIINVKLFENNGSAFLHIFCWQIKGSFVVSANMAVAMGMDFEYTTQKRYNFSVRVKAKTSTNETIDLITPNYKFDFYVIGTIGVRAGLRLEMYVGLFSLKLDRIGIVAEVGVYTQLWGYFFYHLEWKQGTQKKSNSAGALYIELGMYLDIKFVATLFNSSKLTWAPTIYANQWPLWSAGQQQNVFAFADSGGTYDFKTVKTLALPSSTYSMQAMDLKTGGIGPVNKDDNSESAFSIAFTNPHFSYTAADNTVTVAPPAGSVNEETDMVITWKKAALAFTSKPIQKTIHIKWSDPENVRYIDFNSWGGSAVAQITGGSGAAITWPANPEKQGYTFEGWYTDLSLQTAYTGSTTVMPTFSTGVKGMTLYAKWKPAMVSYTVEHYQQELNGAYTLSKSETMWGLTGKLTATDIAPDPGFRLWSHESGRIAADGSTVVKFYYNRINYTVTWKPGYGNATWIKQTYKHGAALAAPTVSREGYTFTGWDVTPPATVTGNATYTARWTPKTYTVTLDVNGGDELSGGSAKTVTYDAAYGGALTEPTRTGYIFTGWYTKKTGGKKVESTDTVKNAENTTLYAHWKERGYTVTFDPMGGTLADEQKTKNVIYNSRYGALPKPTLQGYNFVGWYTANDDSGKKVDANTRVETAGEHTLYARWTPGNVTYTVKHFWQNVADDQYTEHETERPSGTTGQQTAATAKIYEGFGAAKEFEQATIAADGSTVVNIYYDRTRHTVTWMNEGTVLKTDTGVKYGATPNYTGDTPTKTGTETTVNEFIGWNTEADGSGTPLNTSGPMPDNPFTVTGDVTFYAQFVSKEKTCTVSFALNYTGSETAPESITAPYLGVYGTLPTPERTGYNFAGWYTEQTGGTEVTAETKVETDRPHTLYAHWTGKTYTVTFDPNGGALSDGSTKTVTYGEEYGTLPIPTRGDYVFLGWFRATDGDYDITKDDNVRWAEPHTLYAHWVSILQVGGQEVTRANCGNVFSDGTVRYNFNTNTLTLNGYNFNGDPAQGPSKINKEGEAIHFRGQDATKPLTIVLNGENTIRSTPKWPCNASGIHVTGCDVVIQGSGTLKVTAVGDRVSATYGIFVHSNYSLTIQSGTITATGIASDVGSYWRDQYGICADMTINGGTVTAQANLCMDKYDMSYGVSRAPTINGGSLTACGYTAAGSNQNFAPTLGTGVTAVVSSNFSGQPSEPYPAGARLTEYKYFRAEKR